MNLFVYLNPPSIIRSSADIWTGWTVPHLNSLFFMPPGCRSGFIHVSVYICCTYNHHVDDDRPQGAMDGIQGTV